MIDRKIFLCTTFREFDNSENDRIQRLFMDSIKSQTYQNYCVVVTTFKENTVKKAIVEKFHDKAVVKNVKLDSYKFSLTSVVENCIQEAEKDEDSIIIWCTCDIVLQENFFQSLVENYFDDLAGLAHPNIIYSDVEHFKMKQGNIGTLQQGIDILFFSTKLLISTKVREDIANYRFYNWGVFELFLVAIAMNYSNNKINLFPGSIVSKIENDRKANKETKAYFARCLNLNFPVLDKYVRNKGIDRRMTRDLYFCHKQYIPVYCVKEYQKIRLKFLITCRFPWLVKRQVLRIIKPKVYMKMMGR